MKPVYLIAGEDEYLRNKSIDKIKNKLKRNLSERNDPKFSIYYAPRINIQEVLDEVRSSDFFNQQSLVLLKNIENLNSEEKERILKYCNNPSRDSTLILETSDKKFTKQKFFNELKGITEYIACNSPYLSKIHKYIKQFAAERNKRITSQAASILIMNLGNDLRKIDEAVEKLSLYVDSRKDITEEDTEVLIDDNVNYDAYNLTDAIGSKNTDQALKVIKRLAVNRSSSLKLLGMVNWHLRRIYEAKELLRQGQNPRQVATTLNVHSFFQDKFMRAVENFSFRQLNEAFKNVLEADFTLKTKKTRSKQILETLVIRLCSL